MAVFFDFITMAMSLFCLAHALKRLNQGPRYFIYLVFFIVLIAPLYLDYLIGKPDYYAWQLGSLNRGFILSYDDQPTRIIYDLILLASQAVLLGVKNAEQVCRTSLLDSFSVKQKNMLLVCLTIAASLPVLLTLVLPLDNRMIYLWGWRDAGLFEFDQSLYYKIERLAYIGVASSLFLLFLNRKNLTKLVNFMWVFLLYANVCIEAKRSILFFAVLFLFSLLVSTATKRQLKKIIIVFLIIAVMTIIISIFVKTQYRGYSSDFAVLYGNLRVDYFRDDTVKMLIYATLHPDQIHVLDFPLQSYLMQVGCIFPLDFLKLPVLGYNTYFTCALVGQPISTGLSYTTTSMFDELIANFGFIGMFLVPLVAFMFSKYASSQPIEFQSLVSSCFLLLSMYSFNYVSWYVEAVLILLIALKASKGAQAKRIVNDSGSDAFLVT